MWAGEQKKDWMFCGGQNKVGIAKNEHIFTLQRNYLSCAPQKLTLMSQVSQCWHNSTTTEVRVVARWQLFGVVLLIVSDLLRETGMVSILLEWKKFMYEVPLLLQCLMHTKPNRCCGTTYGRIPFSPSPLHSDNYFDFLSKHLKVLFLFLLFPFLIIYLNIFPQLTVLIEKRIYLL